MSGSLGVGQKGDLFSPRLLNEQFINYNEKSGPEGRQSMRHAGRGFHLEMVCADDAVRTI